MYKKVFLPFFCILPILFLKGPVQAQSPGPVWVDSVYQTLTLDDKIGQLFMLPVYPCTDADYMSKIRQAVKSHAAGGLIFMEGSPTQLASIRNEVQQQAQVPLLIGVDGVGGLGHKIDSLPVFPPALMLGAISDNTLLYSLGREIAREMKLLGVHINFAPSAELSSVKQYDSTGRSFGQQKENVAAKAVAYMQGMQDHGVLACAKHFPMQGLTVVDIKKNGLPTLNAYVDSVALHPFRQLFLHQISGVLPASSDFPLFYSKKRIIRQNVFTPTLLSSIYAGEWLRKNMDYEGLVYVSIPDIQGDEADYKEGEAEALAFQAGNDIILFPEDVTQAIRRIKKLLRKDSAYTDQLNRTVKRILAAKYQAGLPREKEIITENLYEKLNTTETTILRNRLFEQMVTVARNAQQLLPIKILEDRRIATLSFGRSVPNPFSEYTSRYTHERHFSWFEGQQDADSIYQQLETFRTILVALFEPPSAPLLQMLAKLQADHEVVLCVLGDMEQLSLLEKFHTVMLTYTGEEEMIKKGAEALFGAFSVAGTLPLTISDGFEAGQGETLPALKRFQYSFPEDAGMDSEVLKKIAAIAQEAIELHTTPGCQVLVAKDGKVVYQQAFGYQTYDSLIPVNEHTIYDLASVTKVMATLQTIMFMEEHGLIDVHKKVSSYLPELKNSNKKDFTIKDILTHQAGLWPFLPFWAETMKDATYLPAYYSKDLSPQYPYMVADHLYASRAMRDSLWHWIIRARVRDKVNRTPYTYRYSDMGFYIFQHLAEKLLNQPIEDFLNQNLYEPLGAYTTGYLPLQRFPKLRLAPTENDQLFRKQLLIGTVHDQGAAMQGGVAGHAGLFSDAGDLAKIGQMLLQEGFYGGIQYYKPETVRLFTHRQYASSRRGLGWDKPEPGSWHSPASIYASPRAFGHTGFTGTCIWVDPEFNLVYVFLSNRVYPDMTNNKLLRENIRSRIQDTVYQAIFSYCRHHASVSVPAPMAAARIRTK